MKRLVVCSDGTWQQLTNPYPTNVVKIAQALKSVASDGISQIVFYDEGVGTGERLDQITGGAFGWGIDQNIQDAYRFLCLNYEQGDEIYLFGFSRGAYTVRSLGGLLAYSGLLTRNNIRMAPEAYNLYRRRDINSRHPDAIQFRNEYSFGEERLVNRVPIKLLACWDTVGALGLPDQIPIFSQLTNHKYKFHNTNLSSIIEHARHAVAIDETRQVFDVTPMERSPHCPNQDIHQMWFPGDHGCVGGGIEAHRGLSDAALGWMMNEAKLLGLDFDQTKIQGGGLYLNHRIPFELDRSPIFAITGQINREITGLFEIIHESAKKRWRDLPNYRPQNLVQRYAQELNTWALQNPAQVLIAKE